MNRNAAWFVPAAVAVTCIPCLLIPLIAALIAAGAFGGALGFLGVPWLVAVSLIIPVGAALLYLRFRRKGAGCPAPKPPTWPDKW